MLAHLIPIAVLLCDIVLLFFHKKNENFLVGVDVFNGSFNGTAPENCEGETVTQIQMY